MPNWCNNTLTLTHEDPAVIARAKVAFLDGKFLSEFIPCPQDLIDTVSGFVGEGQEALEAKQAANREKYGYATWYDFCVNEWGTKWDVGGGDYNEPQQETPNDLTVSFDSAWAPPTTAYAKLEELGFKILAMYYEPGMAFAGVYEDGTDDYYEYGGLDSAGIAETLPSALDEAFGISESVAEWEAENAEEE
jgi:hypothetical protein